MAHHVVWWRWVGAVPVCPPVSPHKGASVVHSPRTMCVYLLWKRRYVDVRAGTQAPPLRILLERIARGRLVSFGQVARGMGNFVWGGLCVNGYFVCVGLRGKI